MKTFRWILVFVLVFVVAVLPVLAQESAADPVSSLELSLEDLAANLFTLLYNQTYLPFAVPAVVLLTALTKRILAVRSNILVLFWTVILWAGWVAAVEIGYGGQFETLVAALATIGSTLFGMTLTPILAGQVYQKAQASGVALLGYSRTTASSIASDVDKIVLSS